MPKLKYPNKSHPGRAGRKASPVPSFWKRFRATEDERGEFMTYLSGDARQDFIDVLNALRLLDTKWAETIQGIKKVE